MYLIAWAFTVFTLLIFWRGGVLRDNEYRYRDAYRGRLLMTSGTVTRIEDTRAARTGGSKGGIRYPIYRISFTFRTPDRQYTGTSYFTHYSSDPVLPYQPRERVTVEYPPGRPAFARIQGLRHNLWETSALYGIFYVAGVAIICFLPGISYGIPRIRRLRRSLVTQAQLKRCKHKVTQLEQPYYLGTFYFSEQSRDGTSGARHHVTMRRDDRPWVSADSVFVLYDPMHPETGRPFTDALTIDDYQIDATGKIKVPFWLGKWELIPPALALIVLLVLLCDL